MKTYLFIVLIFVNKLSFASWVTTYQELSSDLEQIHRIHEVSTPHEIQEAKNFEELERAYGNVDLKLIYNSSSEDFVTKNNQNILRLLKHDEISEEFEFIDKKKNFLSRSEVKRIFRDTSRIRVVEREERYDREEVIGFCFGRAFISHHISHLKGVHPKSIKKIWVVGDMKKWAHHVATILKTDNGWMAIDTYTGLLSVERWIQRMERDKKRNAKELMFFVTNATRFGHENNNFYNSIDLFNIPEDKMEEFEDKSSKEIKSTDFYRGYFLDFFKELDRRIDRYKAFD